MSVPRPEYPSTPILPQRAPIAEGKCDHLGCDTYAMLIAAGNKPHFIAYYVLHMALQGRPWNDCKGAEKAALRAKFDQIKSSHSTSDAKNRLDLEAALQFFGVVEKPKKIK